MSDPDHSVSTPPRSETGTPSIYAYQTRLMRDPSTETSPASAAASSSRPLSRIGSFRDETSVSGLRRSGSGARIAGMGHTRTGSKSVDLARNKWEAKIEAAAHISDPAPPPTLRRPKSAVFPPASVAASYLSNDGSGAAPKDATPAAQADTVKEPRRAKSEHALKAARNEQAAAEAGTTTMPGTTSTQFPVSQTDMSLPTTTGIDDFGRMPRARPSSISSFASLSPSNTGTSISTMRQRSAADTLAEARANALRRLEAKKKAGIPVEEPKIDLPPLPVSEPPSIKRVASLEPLPPRVKTSSLPKSPSAVSAGIARMEAATASVQEPPLTLSKRASVSSIRSAAEHSPKVSTTKPLVEDVRPAVKTVESPTAQQPPTVAYSSPFGERLRTAPKQEPAAMSAGKFEPPVLRKVKSVDLGSAKPAEGLPTSPARLSEAPLVSARPLASSTPTDGSSSPLKAASSESSAPKPKFAGLTYRAPTGPPKGTVNSLASRFANGEASTAPTPRGRIPSLGADKRRLGKHLPRIVSGDQGWEGDGRRKPSLQARVASSKNRKTSLSQATMPAPTEENTPPRASAVGPSPAPAAQPTRPVAPLSPSSSINRAQPPKAPSTPSKRTSKPSLFITPRAEVAGDEMKGLMSAVGSAPMRKTDAKEADGVTGMTSRVRLSSRLPLAASSAAMAPAPLPSKRLAANNNWMDRQRHALAAYEYLCHVGEAQQWIEGCLDEELEFGVTEMDEGLRDGVVLAKLARVFQGDQVVRRIWTEAKHRFRQSDNINYFLNFIRTVGMPETFIFELTDLYNKKNIPKVIFCIHVLSHLLARLGRAERMNNLVGQFEFTHEQLAATEKGIQGVAMPNFQSVGQTLAKEASWEEPEEEEEETEDERRDRELLECESSIASLQHHLRGVLARQRKTRVKAQLKLAAPIITKLQSQARGHMSRRAVATEKKTHRRLCKWATALQANCRRHLAQRHWRSHVANVRASSGPIVGIQAHARGMLARMRQAHLDNSLDRSRRAIVGIQAYARGRVARRDFKQHRGAVHHPSTVRTVTSVQAVLRAELARTRAEKKYNAVAAHTATFVSVQSHLRGALVRRQQRARERKMDDATGYVVAIQAQARGILARRRKQIFARQAVKMSTSISSLQALARGRLAQKQHDNMRKALAKVEVAGSVGGLQAFLRTRLAKHKTVEQKKKLEFVQPDVIGFQAMARGVLARREYREWRDYLVDPHTQGALVFLQSLVRGFLSRRRFWMRRAYLYHNQDKIVKVQALWRGKQQRRMYDRLITGSRVDVPTIQNYMHLLDDTESDFRDQLTIDTLRKEVVEVLRTNQTLETEVQELDTKIALILKNKMSFEDLVRAKRRHGVPSGDDAFSAPGGGDPFAGVHLDRTSQRKLELYEHLFFTLQTEPQYLSRLLHKLASEEEFEKDCRLVEGVTLILFGFGHDTRSEYLFHKLCQISLHEQILRSRSLQDLCDTRFAIHSVATQYVKPLLTPFLQNVLREHIQKVVQAEDLDLSTDPVEMYNRLINAEEMLTGVKSPLPRDLDAEQVLATHAETRTLYIQHLQELRAITNLVATAIMASTVYLPYSIRLMAREALLALRVRYRDVDDLALWPVIAKAIVLPFILPAIVAPETYGIAENVNPIQRRNLAAVANLLGHVAAQDFSKPDRLVRVPLNEYIRAEGQKMGDWILDVAEVDFQVQEMLESTTEAAPISITRTDVYGLLGVLMRNIPALTAGRSGDPIESVLTELEGAPLEYDKSNRTVRIRLTNRLAQLQPNDPEAARLRELEVQAKRHVLAVLRVQTGKTLYDVLLSHPTDTDEQRWIQEVHRDIALEQVRREQHDLPPTPTETEYQMESIRSLPFHEVKSRAIEFCMSLVESGKLSREDHLEGLLVSIAWDIREKHRLRQKRKVDLRAMSEAQAHQAEKRQKFEEQIQSYHDYIDSAMSALQQKKKAPFMSRQYWHQRGKRGKSKFGSYKYTAADLYEKGILLGVNQFSPRQFDKLHIVISSNHVGVFTLEMNHPAALESGLIGKEELRMEDLLQAQFDNNVRLDLFDGMAAFNLNTLIHQINKKFYAS